MKNLFTKNYWATKVLALLVFVVMGGGVKGQTAYNMSLGNKTWDLAGTWSIDGNSYLGTDANNWASVEIIGSGTSVTSGTRTTKTSASIVTGTSGGLQKPSGTIQFLSTGSGATPEAVAIDLLLNFTGRNAGTLSFDWAAIDNVSGTRPTSLRIFWSTDGSNFTELTGAQQLNRESATSPSSGTVSGVSLPSNFNGSSTARIRFYNHAGGSSGSGNRDKFQIDNIAVTSTSSSTAPLAPTITSITPSNQQLSVAFTAGNDGGSAITSYNYSTDGGTSFLTRQSGTTASPIVITTLSSDGITPLSNGTSYNVQIKAVNAIGDGTATSSSAAIPGNNWTGTASNLWNANGNWSYGTIPTGTDYVVIATGTPQIDGDVTIGAGSTLKITGTGTLTINPTRTLTIAGTADFGGKSVTLKSDNTGSAAIGQITGTLSNATNLTVERYIPALRKFRFLAASVVGATAANWRNNGTNTAGIGTQITGTGGAANNFDASTTNAPSAFWYNEVLAGSDVTVGSGATSDPGWTAFANGNTEALTNGKGFRILVRGDRTISLDGSGSTTPTITTLSVTGTYPANSVSIATTKTNSNTNSGFNLVGNPYPATIDWNLVTKGTDISATYTIYDPTSNSYKSWNGSSGAASQYIASSQAFFVQQTGATGGITIDESDKVTNAAGNYFRNKLADHLKVSMTYDSANYDATFIHFRADALNDFDTYDGLKFQNAGVNIASVGSDGKRYNINSLASLTETTEIPLSVLGSVLTNFELKFEDVESFKNHELYLIDHHLNKMLLLSDGFTYPITLSSDSASVKDGRFKIVFVQKATGINPNEKISNAFILYPNPAANTIHLLLDAKNTNNENVSFEIFNQLGARLQQGRLDFTTAKDQTIAIDNLAQGSYLIKLQSNSNQQTIKFIK
jgi:hypothetical protein